MHPITPKYFSCLPKDTIIMEVKRIKPLPRSIFLNLLPRSFRKSLQVLLIPGFGVMHLDFCRKLDISCIYDVTEKNVKASHRTIILSKENSTIFSSRRQLSDRADLF